MVTVMTEWRSRMEDRIIRQGEDIASIKQAVNGLKEVMERHIECQSSVDSRQNDRLEKLEKKSSQAWQTIAITLILAALTGFITKVINLW